MPRSTDGTAPVPPAVPTVAPSATVAPWTTPIEASCVSVTDQPSAVSIVTDLPFDGTVPAKETTPAAGARTTAPAPAPTSMSRCWPAA